MSSFLSSLLQNDFDVIQINSNNDLDLIIKGNSVNDDQWMKVKTLLNVSQNYISKHPNLSNLPFNSNNMFGSNCPSHHMSNSNTYPPFNSNIIFGSNCHVSNIIDAPTMSNNSHFFNIKTSYENSAIFCYESTLTKYYVLYDEYPMDMNLQMHLKELSNDDIIHQFKETYSNGVKYSKSILLKQMNSDTKI